MMRSWKGSVGLKAELAAGSCLVPGRSPTLKNQTSTCRFDSTGKPGRVDRVEAG